MADRPSPSALPMRTWFEKADREVKAALVDLLTCTTGVPGDFSVPERIDWREFNRLSADFENAIRERHAAKHAALREAYIAPTPLFIDLDKDVREAWEGSDK